MKRKTTILSLCIPALFIISFSACRPDKITKGNWIYSTSPQAALYAKLSNDTFTLYAYNFHTNCDTSLIAMIKSPVLEHSGNHFRIRSFGSSRDTEDVYMY